MRVFIASADSDFRLALMMLLEGEPGFAVTGTSDRSESLPTSVGALRPEVVLLDYRLANRATPDLIGELLFLRCPPKVLVLSTKPQARETSLAAGAEGFINQSAPPDDLLPILRSMRSSPAMA